MSHSLATPPPQAVARNVFARIWADPDGRSVSIGLIAALLVHLLLLIFGPILFKGQPVTFSSAEAPARPQFDIEIAPDTFTKTPEKPSLPNFVEANPDAPENTPDKTDNVSDRNQQVAQEKPTPDGKSERPATEGKKDFVNPSQIVNGRLTQPLEHMEAIPPSQFEQAQTAVAAPRAEQNPLPGFEKKINESADSVGSNIARIPENVANIPNRIEGMKGVPVVDGATGAQPAIDPKRPRPRPQVVSAPQARPAILEQNNFGTSNIGITAFNAKWSPYGEYLRRLIETVQKEWNNILESGKIIPPSGTFVVVRFILNAEGGITRIVKVDNQSSDKGAESCVAAITSRAPYGPWTEDMVQLLGTEQELTFTFHYQ